MRRLMTTLIALALIASACTQRNDAETESLSVLDEEIASSSATTGDESPADPGQVPSPAGQTVEAESTSVAPGGTVTVRSVGLGDSPTWSAASGSLDGEGDGATFTAPDLVGHYTITAADGGRQASTVISVEEMLLYESDFSSDPGAEWNTDLVAEAPSGERFLGEFSQDTVTLLLDGLPTHDQVSVAFDLYVLRSWDGLAENDWWGMQINDERVIATTFSNDAKRQAWPGALPYADNPGRSGAFATDSLGYEFRDVPADASYHVEQTFLHEGQRLWLDFEGHNLSGVDDESWGIDNLEVRISRTPADVVRPEAALTISITDRELTVSGTVPDPSVEETIRSAADDWFGGWNVDVEVQAVEGAINPIWTTRFRDVLHAMRDVQNGSLELDLKTAHLSGSVVSQRYLDDLVAGLDRDLGSTVWLTNSLDLASDQAALATITSSVALFDAGSADLSDEATGVLDGVADLLVADRRIRVFVTGHTDLTGAAEENGDLSWERARAAAAYLESRGVQGEQINVNGRGGDDPADAGTSAEAHAANRRVTFFVQDG